MKRVLKLQSRAFAVIAVLFSMLVFIPSARANDPCPDLEDGVSAGQLDSAAVQNDIERLALCVQRAQLLAQLDELTRKRLELTEEPISELPPQQVFMPPTPSRQQRFEAPAAPVFESFTPDPEWSIVRMWGQGGRLRAQLVSDSGNSVSVSQGEKLPSGETIKSIDVNGVTLTLNGGGTQALNWSEGTF